MSKVCIIDSDNIVNGTGLFYQATLAQWDSPLSKLQNGSFMFGYNQNFYYFKADMPNLKNAAYMFEYTNASFDTGDGSNYGDYAYTVDLSQFTMNLPKLKDATGMFRQANLYDSHYNKLGHNGTTRLARMIMKMDQCNNINQMFCKTKADIAYLVLSNFASDRYDYNTTAMMAFENATIDFVSIHYSQALSNCTQMFNRFYGNTIRLNFGGRYYDYHAASPISMDSMFKNATFNALELSSEMFNTEAGFDSYGYYSYGNDCIRLGDENFFNTLAALTKGSIQSTREMFKDYKYKSFAVQESIFDYKITDEPNGGWYGLEDCSYMFAGSKCSVVRLGGSTFTYNAPNHPNRSGVNASYMFKDCTSIGQYSAYGTGVIFSDYALYDIISAQGMFQGCTRITNVNISDRALSGLIGNYSSQADCRDMFKGCTSLTGFYFGKDSDNQYTESTYDRASLRELLGILADGGNLGDIQGGVKADGMFSGCKINNARSLINIGYFAAAADAITVGVDKWCCSMDSKMKEALQSYFGVTYPATAGTIKNCAVTIEYNG